MVGVDVGPAEDLKQLVGLLESGRCTPFLGAGASLPHVPLGSEIAGRWATEHGYPLADRNNLPRVMQYVATKYATGIKDATALKEEIVESLFAGLDPPNFNVVGQIHGVLGRFPLPIYITTNYDDLMLQALLYHKKHPQRAISPWYGGAHRGPIGPRGYAPAPETPLVFHLHGHAEQPGSLVLTEDDYIEYLVKLAADRRRPADKDSLLPPVVREALRNRPLLFIGYSLEDWTFRVLFRTLLHGIPDGQLRRHVSVQIEPASSGAGGSGTAGREYLEEYFRSQKITIFWDKADEFAKKIAREMRGKPGWPV